MTTPMSAEEMTRFVDSLCALVTSLAILQNQQCIVDAVHLIREPGPRRGMRRCVGLDDTCLNLPMTRHRLCARCKDIEDLE